MFTTLFGTSTEQECVTRKVPKEGDLFKVITAYGKTFEILYGYYEECDRHTKDAEPMEIYPNFAEKPQYTDEGVPFVTEMQVSCKHYKGKIYEDSVCGECAFYQSCDELLGVCNCHARKKENEVAI